VNGRGTVYRGCICGNDEKSILNMDNSRAMAERICSCKRESGIKENDLTDGCVADLSPKVWSTLLVVYIKALSPDQLPERVVLDISIHGRC